jgi:hypothetical protein
MFTVWRADAEWCCYGGAAAFYGSGRPISTQLQQAATAITSQTRFLRHLNNGLAAEPLGFAFNDFVH